MILKVFVCVGSFVFFGNSVSAGESWETQFETYTKGLPTDVVSILKRIDDCNHFQGESPYDEKRKQQIVKAMKTFRCDQLDGDRKAVIAKYKPRLDVRMKIENFLKFKWQD